MGLFKRKIYDELLRWKETYGGTKALCLEGARRVGKTTVVREFGRREYRSCIVIDFSVRDDTIRDLILHSSADLNLFFLQVQARYGIPLHDRRSLIVFDEVQLFPPAREMIKRLVADGRYDYIETGSLISMTKNVEDILVPSGERVLEMHPMDFEEFLWAMGDQFTMSIVRDAFDRREPLGSSLHKSIMEKYRIYMVVGGMPEAVDRLTESWNYGAVDETMAEICRLYEQDMSKIHTGETKAGRIFSAIPSMLAKHEKTFSPGMIRKDSRTREYLDAVHWLSLSKTVNVCRRCSDPGPALDQSLDENSFKLYMADTGLLAYMMFRSNMEAKEELYRKITDGKLSVNQGMFFENMVAQELTAAGVPLVFGRFESDGKSREVDFLMAVGDRVLPIEVKSGYSGKHTSLDLFMEKYSDVAGPATVIHSKDLRVDGGVLYVPIYMTMLLRPARPAGPAGIRNPFARPLRPVGQVDVPAVRRMSRRACPRFHYF